MNNYDILNLDEIIEFVKIIISTSDINDFSKTIYMNDVTYNIDKYGNKLIISSTKGKMIDIEIKSKNDVKIDSIEQIIDIKYNLSNNEELNLITTVSFDISDYDLKNLERDNLYENYELYYTKKKEKKTPLLIDLNNINVINSKNESNLDLINEFDINLKKIKTVRERLINIDDTRIFTKDELSLLINLLNCYFNLENKKKILKK